ncbi:uncharacterized protein DS421_10g296780 [Arachis hypogaea]|nr:uncharacterized protein DS421_10g296780 [Arachis hypogaea]
MFYVIDELDNCLVLEDNQPIQVHLDYDVYVPELMDPKTLDNVSRVFHIKYTRIDEDSSADVMVLSGSKPSDDQFSSNGDENNDQDGTLVGVDLHNLIDLSSRSSLSLEVNEQSNMANELSDPRYAPEVFYEKIITTLDLGQSRLYLASKFAVYLKLSGDRSIWMITGADSNIEKNVFFFHLLKNGARNCELYFFTTLIIPGNGSKNLVAQYHGITQLRTTNQQVHWVVQVINLTQTQMIMMMNENNTKSSSNPSYSFPWQARVGSHCCQQLPPILAVKANAHTLSQCCQSPHVTVIQSLNPTQNTTDKASTRLSGDQPCIVQSGIQEIFTKPQMLVEQEWLSVTLFMSENGDGRQSSPSSS